MTKEEPRAEELHRLAVAAKAHGHARSPPRDLGEIAIHIAKDGSWFYRGTPISRASLVRLFASVLRREADGSYWLVTPAERGKITVEETPFLAVELTVGNTGTAGQFLTFRTNLDEIVTADTAHPLRVETDAKSGEPRPYLRVRAGLEARLTRSVFYELVELGTEELVGGMSRFGIWSSGEFFWLGDLR